MKHLITVLTAIVDGRKKFVKLGDKRDNQKFTMSYVNNADFASDFEDEDQALNAIRNIHNPFERELAVEGVIIDLKPEKSINSGSLK